MMPIPRSELGVREVRVFAPVSPVRPSIDVAMPTCGDHEAPPAPAWHALPPDFVARIPAHIFRSKPQSFENTLHVSEPQRGSEVNPLLAFAMASRAFRDAALVHVRRVATLMDVDIPRLRARLVDERDRRSAAVLDALLGAADEEEVRAFAQRDPHHVFYLWLRDVSQRIAHTHWHVQTSRGYSCEIKPENGVLAGTACEFLLELPVPDDLVPQTPGWATLFETCKISPSSDVKRQCVVRQPPAHTALNIGPLAYACRYVEHNAVHADEREHWIQAHHVGLYVESENPWRKRDNDDGYDRLPVRAYLHALDVCELAINASIARPLSQGGYQLPRTLQDIGTYDDNEVRGVRIFLNAYTERGKFVSCAELSLHWTAPSEARAAYHTLLLNGDDDDDPAVTQANAAIDCVIDESFVDITVMATGGMWDPVASFGRARVEVWAGAETTEEARMQYDFHVDDDEHHVERYSLHFIPDYDNDDARRETSSSAQTWNMVANALENNCLEFFVVRHQSTLHFSEPEYDSRIALGVRFTVDPESATARVLRLM